MDADLNLVVPKIMSFLKYGNNKFTTSSGIGEIKFIVDMYQLTNKRYEYVIGDFNNTLNLLLEHVERKENVVVCCTHHGQADEIANRISTLRKLKINHPEDKPKIAFIHGKEGNGSSKSPFARNFIEDPDEILGDCNTLIMTPALVNAVSITNGRFKHVFCFAKFGSIHYRDVLQQVSRIRCVGEHPVIVFIGAYDTPSVNNSSTESILGYLDQRNPYYVNKKEFQFVNTLMEVKPSEDILTRHLIDTYVDVNRSNSNLKGNIIKEIRESGCKLTYMNEWMQRHAENVYEQPHEYKLNSQTGRMKLKHKRKPSDGFLKTYKEQKKKRKQKMQEMVVELPLITDEQQKRITKGKHSWTPQVKALLEKKQIVDLFGKPPTSATIEKQMKPGYRKLYANYLKMQHPVQSDLNELSWPAIKQNNWVVRGELCEFTAIELGFKSMKDTETKIVKPLLMEKIELLASKIQSDEQLLQKFNLVFLRDMKLELKVIQMIFQNCGIELKQDKATSVRFNSKPLNPYRIFRCIDDM
jgi:hypothetical protein